MPPYHWVDVLDVPRSGSARGDATEIRFVQRKHGYNETGESNIHLALSDDELAQPCDA